MNWKKLNIMFFDLIDKNNFDLPFYKRFEIIKNNIKNYNNICLVPTFIVKNKTEIDKYLSEFLKKGYEGAIVRNRMGIYKMKSSSKDLQKIKPYHTKLFKIVNYHQASGK